MIRRTYAQSVGQLRRVAGSAGMDTSDARIMDYVNLATEELMNEHDFPWTVDTLRFRVTQCRLTLPSAYDRAMMMNLDCFPMTMQSPWFEFVGYGPGLITSQETSSNGTSYLHFIEGALDQGEVASFNDPPTDDIYTLRVVGQHDEQVDGVRPQIIVQGYDSDNRWIRTASGNGYIDGVTIEINGDTTPYIINSPQTISKITGIIKPETNGYVYVYAVPTTVGTLTYLGAYAPQDTNPVYRRYNIPNLSSDETFFVKARCRLRYRPITQPGDQLIISNLSAMQTMIRAVYYNEANKFDDYQACKAAAVDMLKKEAKSYIGLQRQKPLITFNEGMGTRMNAGYIL